MWWGTVSIFKVAQRQGENRERNEAQKAKHVEVANVLDYDIAISEFELQSC